LAAARIEVRAFNVVVIPAFIFIVIIGIVFFNEKKEREIVEFEYH